MGMAGKTIQPGVSVEERMIKVSPLRRLLVRPEMGAVAGSILVWLFFAIVAGRRGFLSLGGTATYLDLAANLGILAVAVALLMIGGEFDLSIGSIIGASGMIVAILAVQRGWNIWAAVVVAILFALLIGFLNGYLVVRTGLPSFIITLGSLFIIRGATIGMTRVLTGRTQLGGLDKAPGEQTALSEVVPALGVNLYLRPINKNVPLRLKGGFMRRFAFTFGVTSTGIADGGGNPPTRSTRDDLVGSNSLLLGAGYRLSGSTRLTTGAIVFYELDPNPLKDDRTVSYSPFIALSFDSRASRLRACRRPPAGRRARRRPAPRRRTTRGWRSPGRPSCRARRGPGLRLPLPR